MMYEQQHIGTKTPCTYKLVSVKKGKVSLLLWEETHNQEVMRSNLGAR